MGNSASKPTLKDIYVYLLNECWEWKREDQGHFRGPHKELVGFFSTVNPNSQLDQGRFVHNVW